MNTIKRFLFFAAMISIVMASCRPSAKQHQTLNEKIVLFEQALFNEGSIYSKDSARMLMDLYVRYADSLPEDQQSVEYLFKAADLSMYVAEPGRTIWLLDRLMTRYPDHEKTAMSLFLKAFVYDTRLDDTASARHFYKLFTERYPGHEFAGEAQAAIRNLGKTPEDLIREFEQLNNN